MSNAYHVIIGTEEIRVPPAEIERFRNDLLHAARDGARWVPLRMSESRTLEFLITPFSTVRIEAVAIDDEDEDVGDDDAPHEG